jgi:hypothetical protein
MLGETNPRDSKPGTIRGDFCIQVSEHFILASRKPETLAVYLEDTMLYLSYTKWCQVLSGHTHNWLDGIESRLVTALFSMFLTFDYQMICDRKTKSHPQLARWEGTSVCCSIVFDH